MSDVQWFAFVILPIAVGVIGWAYELLAERFERELPAPRTGRVSRLQ